MTWIQKHAYGIWLVGLGIGLAVVLQVGYWVIVAVLQHFGLGMGL